MLTPSPSPGHRTFAGRIVYNRRIHFFSLADVNRVIRGYFIGNKSPIDILQQIIFDLSVGMLRIILARFGVLAFAEVLFFFMHQVVDFVLRTLSQEVISQTIPQREGPDIPVYANFITPAVADLEELVLKYTGVPLFPTEPPPEPPPEVA